MGIAPAAGASLSTVGLIVLSSYLLGRGDVLLSLKRAIVVSVEQFQVAGNLGIAPAAGASLSTVGLIVLSSYLLHILKRENWEPGAKSRSG